MEQFGVELYSPPRLAVLRTERVGKHKIRGFADVFIAVTLISAAVSLWNSYSNGGLIRALGVNRGNRSASGTTRTGWLTAVDALPSNDDNRQARCSLHGDFR